MRKIFFGWLWLEVESARWRGAPEWAFVFTTHYARWTWRHRQGVFFFRPMSPLR